jgi:hypothetical protein
VLTVSDIVGGRPGRWVHISELGDPTPWLRGDERGVELSCDSMLGPLRAHALRGRRELEPVP